MASIAPLAKTPPFRLHYTWGTVSRETGRKSMNLQTLIDVALSEQGKWHSAKIYDLDGKVVWESG